MEKKTPCVFTQWLLDQDFEDVENITNQISCPVNDNTSKGNVAFFGEDEGDWAKIHALLKNPMETIDSLQDILENNKWYKL